MFEKNLKSLRQTQQVLAARVRHEGRNFVASIIDQTTLVGGLVMYCRRGVMGCLALALLLLLLLVVLLLEVLKMMVLLLLVLMVKLLKVRLLLLLLLKGMLLKGGGGGGCRGKNLLVREHYLSVSLSSLT